MPPQEQIDVLKRELAELRDDFNKLRSSTTIPYDIDQAFQQRIGDKTLKVSTKGVNTEDQAVNEGGVATYDVLGDPDGFLQITIANTIYYLPYY